MQSSRLKYIHYLQGKGLEIGGLNSPLPLPDGAEAFYSDILTPEEIERHYPGSQKPDIISNSEEFPDLESNKLPFVISNHVLEHVTDPIKALKEWYRILAPSGILYLTVPDKRFTFDRTRDRTNLEHLISDHESDLLEKELNLDHLKDWATHVEKLTPNSKEWKAWVDGKYKNGYSVHNHVWVMEDILDLFDYLKRECSVFFRVIDYQNTSIFEIEFILILQKVQNNSSASDFIAIRKDVIDDIRKSPLKWVLRDMVSKSKVMRLVKTCIPRAVVELITKFM